MKRIYLLGIVYMLLALNIPEVNKDVQARVRFADPIIRQQLSVARDKAEPALLSIYKDLAQRSTITIADNGNVVRILDVTTDTSDTWSLTRGNSITAEQFDAILRDYNSPALGVGKPVSDYAASKKIDNAYILYIFIHESTAGTNRNWAGYKPDGSTTHNIGNVICAGYPTCYGRFRDYPSWEAGFKGAIDNLVAYREQNGINDITMAINRWAPSTENDTNGYVDNLKATVTKWRQANKGEFVATSAGIGEPNVSSPIPLNISKAVSTDLGLSGCLGINVRSGYNSSPKLKDITIPPHSDWSFNENWIINGDGQGVMCGVYYGGICDMAARYSNAARKIGLISHIAKHTDASGALLKLNNVDWEDSVGIWSSGGRGGGDLILENPTDRIAKLRAEIDGDIFRVTAWFEN